MLSNARYPWFLLTFEIINIFFDSTWASTRQKYGDASESSIHWFQVPWFPYILHLLLFEPLHKQPRVEYRRRSFFVPSDLDDDVRLCLMLPRLLSCRADLNRKTAFTILNILIEHLGSAQCLDVVVMIVFTDTFVPQWIAVVWVHSRYGESS